MRDPSAREFHSISDARQTLACGTPSPIGGVPSKADPHLAGSFGFWAMRAPRTDIFKGSVIALAFMFVLLALAAVPASYALLCRLLLRASGSERRTNPALGRAGTTGAGRKEFEIFAHPHDGGCAAMLARLRWHRQVAGPRRFLVNAVKRRRCTMIAGGSMQLVTLAGLLGLADGCDRTLAFRIPAAPATAPA